MLNIYFVLSPGGGGTCLLFVHDNYGCPCPYLYAGLTGTSSAQRARLNPAWDFRGPQWAHGICTGSGLSGIKGLVSTQARASPLESHMGPIWASPLLAHGEVKRTMPIVDHGNHIDLQAPPNPPWDSHGIWMGHSGPPWASPRGPHVNPWCNPTQIPWWDLSGPGGLAHADPAWAPHGHAVWVGGRVLPLLVTDYTITILHCSGTQNLQKNRYCKST